MLFLSDKSTLYESRDNAPIVTNSKIGTRGLPPRITSQQPKPCYTPTSNEFQDEQYALQNPILNKVRT
ncbi:hypothetical protein X798_08172 [Onchocerca flexuosa]|uniref:Uncharacterized protein n=1 Tax=Onchocerca flexuosa TaxID=387005 RepID=A0A238BJM9_9BILA|nr:hypothetical protein X798_08172 [Onchocerca flexuosa]